MIELEAKNIEVGQDILVASNILKKAYQQAFLIDHEGKKITSAQLAIAYLKLYQQTPHEKIGQIKPNDPAKIVELSVMGPGEYYDFYDNGMQSDQIEAKKNLYVYDPYSKASGGIKIEQYLKFYYSVLYPKGYSIGFSPMGVFEIQDNDDIPRGVNANRILARCLQIDLEVGVKKIGSVAREMRIRLGEQAVKGFINVSSINGSHFLGAQYFIYDPIGKVHLASEYGSVLLLNREGYPNVVDGRSVGHQAHSLKAEWEQPGSEEIGSTRAVRSLLKPTRPEQLIDTPYGF